MYILESSPEELLFTSLFVNTNHYIPVKDFDWRPRYSPYSHGQTQHPHRKYWTISPPNTHHVAYYDHASIELGRSIVNRKLPFLVDFKLPKLLASRVDSFCSLLLLLECSHGCRCPMTGIVRSMNLTRFGGLENKSFCSRFRRLTISAGETDIGYPVDDKAVKGNLCHSCEWDILCLNGVCRRVNDVADVADMGIYSKFRDKKGKIFGSVTKGEMAAMCDYACSDIWLQFAMFKDRV